MKAVCMEAVQWKRRGGPSARDITELPSQKRSRAVFAWLEC